MTYIDSAILDLTERCCRQFQLLTGRTNVWLALQLTNLSIIVYFVWAGLFAWSTSVAPRVLVALFCSGLLYVLTQTVFKVPIETYEAAAYRRVAKGFRGARRPPELFAHRLDDGGVVSAGLRSASPVRWESQRVDQDAPHRCEQR